MQLTPEERTSLRGFALVLHAPEARPEWTAAVRELAGAGFAGIAVVDDGTGTAGQPLFAEWRQIRGVVMCGHAVAVGRGGSFRSGIQQALYAFPDVTGVVTADAADAPDDIVRLALAAAQRQDAMVLGARAGQADAFVPRVLLQFLAGAKVSDASSSLRAIPVKFARELLERDAPGDEFELDALIAARYETVPIVEAPVGGSRPTIGPAVNPLTSPRAWFALLRFSSASLAAAVVDNIIFYIALRQGAGLFAAQALARGVSAIFNYLVVRRAVFRADSHHAIAAPRYIALAGANGAVSYGFIRLLLPLLPVPVTVVKILVETALFFSNFTIQREWIFQRKEPGTPGSAREEAPSGSIGLWLWLLLLVPVGAEIYGFRSSHLLAQNRWLPEGAVHFRNYTLAFGAIALVGLLARRWFLPALSAGVVACTVYAVGVTPAGAVLLFVFSATVLGRLVLSEKLEGPLAFLAGTSLWIAGMYAIATLPVHYPALYLMALALPVAVGYQHSRRLISEWLEWFRPGRVPTLGEHAALAGLTFVLIANWLIVLKPEISTDGLAMHLRIPANMALMHAYTIDFRQFIWALMPIGTDLCYAVLYSIGGEYAARLLNFAMLVTIAALVFRGARVFVSRAVALLLALLCVSNPMTYLVTGSMFVENFVAVMVLGGLLALWRFHETHARRYMMLAAILLGTSIALKLGAVAAGLLGLCGLLWEVAQSERGPRPVARKAAVGAVAVLLLLGAIPYAKAYVLTGNPLFPFETSMFRSPLVKGRDIQDTRYNHPLTWQTPLALTFQTDLYHEGQPGSFGFQYLLFLPLIVAGLFAVRSFQSRSAILLGGISALIIASTQSNARYFYFALPPLTLGAAAALSWVKQRGLPVYRAALVAGAIAAFFNVWFLQSADWYHRDFYSAPLFSKAGRDAYLHGSEGSVREVIAWVNRNNTTKPVVFTDNSIAAGLIAPVYANNWHDYSFTMQVQAQAMPLDVYRLFARYGIQEMVVDRRHADRQAAVTQLIEGCGVTEFLAEPFAAMKLRPDCEGALRQLPAGEATCSPGASLPRGRYDDADQRIVFAGKWTAERKFAEPYNKTITFSNVPGSVACFNMEGTGFDYVHATAFNRGRAEIVVDGKVKTTLDHYTEKAVWQARDEIRGLGPGRHAVTIRALPEKSAAANDFYIDVDAIVIY